MHAIYVLLEKGVLLSREKILRAVGFADINFQSYHQVSLQAETLAFFLKVLFSKQFSWMSLRKNRWGEGMKHGRRKNCCELHRCEL